MEVFIHDSYIIIDPLGIAVLAILALAVVATIGGALWWWRRRAGRAVYHGASPSALQSELQIHSADAEPSDNPYRAPSELACHTRMKHRSAV